MTEREIFLAALDLQDPVDRERFLVQACGEDAALRAAVDALFQSHEEAGEFLQTPLVQSPPPADSSSSDVSDPTVHLSKEQLARSATNDGADDDPTLGFLSPSSKAGSLGRLAHYEVLEVLGRGAFGTVLKAFDEKLHRMVAIKVMSAELASTSPARKRFLREARASAAIRHENVVAIHAVEEQPLPYLVMEYIPGQTLQHVLDGHGPLDLPDILRLGQQIASGLAAAHSQGLIHRDIKPANILLEDGIQWKVKITDFGLARAADDASVTQSGMIAGTPMFMSPEQAHTNQIDQRSDLFSFGSVLYQMTSGRPPFRAPTTLAVLRRVTEETPHPIREIIPETPEWLCTIISRLHEKRPEDRYQTAQEVADLLARCQSELQSTGKVTCVPGTVSDSVKAGAAVTPASRKTSTPPEPAVSGVTRSGAVRRLGRKAGLALLALAGLILAVFYFPVLRLQLAGDAEFRNLTRDGKTRITFLQGGKVVAERVGFGDLQLPAGEYDVRIANPDPALKVYNAVLGRRRVLGLSESVTLSSVPEKFTFHSGDRIDFMVAFTRERAAGEGRDSLVEALRFDGLDDYVEYSDLPYPNGDAVKVDLSATLDETPPGLEKDEFLLNWGMGLSIMIVRGKFPHPILDVSFLSGNQLHQYAIDDRLVVGRRFDLTVEYREGLVRLTLDGQPLPESAVRYRLLENGVFRKDARPAAFQPAGLTSACFLGINTSQLPAREGRAFAGKVHRLKLTKGEGEPVVDCDFSRDSGDTLRDLSRAGRDGKIVGATWVQSRVPPDPDRGMNAPGG